MSKMPKTKTRAMSAAGLMSPLAGRITAIIESARGRVQTVVNQEMVCAYWEIGREIVEEEQRG